MLLSIFEYLRASCNKNLLQKIFPKTVNDALCGGKDAQQFVKDEHIVFLKIIICI